MDQEIDYRTKEEIRQYNESSVKRLVYQMYDRICQGRQVFDFGSVQYKYLEFWGLIDLDDYKQYLDQANAIVLSEKTASIKKMFNKESHKENVEAEAKLIAVREYYQSVRVSGIHISQCFN